MQNEKKPIRKLSLLFALIFLSTSFLMAQNAWTSLSKNTPTESLKKRSDLPLRYHSVDLEWKQLKTQLDQAPNWFSQQDKSKYLSLAMPMPDGNFQHFRVAEAPVMEAGLAKKFPDIQSYVGYGIEDKSAYLRFSMSLVGFNGIILSGQHSGVFIQAAEWGKSSDYIVFENKDVTTPMDFECGVETAARDFKIPKDHYPTRMAGDCKLRIYRTAISANGEYSDARGGTIPDVMSAISQMVTNMNAVLEREVSVHLDLVEDNDLLIFLNAATDPFINSNAGAFGQSLDLEANQLLCDTEIGADNYDLGHTMGTAIGTGGIARLRSICQNGEKAKGRSGVDVNPNHPQNLSVVLHEVGHQLGADHTFNNCRITTAPLTEVSAAGAAGVEPGSGSTIMSYAGKCTPWPQQNPDLYYHAYSLYEIGNTLQAGGNCGNVITANNPPPVDAGRDYVIPQRAAFILTAAYPDPGGPYTYCWEQMDSEVDPAMPVPPIPPQPTFQVGPMFRSLPPTGNHQRYLPNLPDKASGAASEWEVIPQIGRTLNFRLTVRDNAPGGGCTAEDDMSVTVHGGSIFFVLEPNGGDEVWTAGTLAEIRWLVGGTNRAPVNAEEVDIFLSTDSGLSFPTQLAWRTPNDGKHIITVPYGINTTTARVMVMGAGNIFYDMSNNDFTITAPPNDFSFLIPEDIRSQSVCADDPFEVNYDFELAAIGNFNSPIDLSISGLPAGLSASFPPTVNSLPATVTVSLTPSGPIASDFYEFTVEASSGGIVKSQIIQLSLSDGPPIYATPIYPLNQATGVSTTPTLIWNSPNGINYRIQIWDWFAGQLVVSTPWLSDNYYHVLPALKPDTKYDWKIKTQNECGETGFSIDYRFVTTDEIECETIAGESCSTASNSCDPEDTCLRNCGTAQATLKADFPNPGKISDVNVIGLEIDHQRISDLTIKLRSPAGTEIVLIDQICGGEGNMANLNLNMNDEASAYSNIPCPPTNGNSYQPLEPLSTFDGQQAKGTWELIVYDGFTGNGGNKILWNLEICYEPPADPDDPHEDDTAAINNDGGIRSSKPVLSSDKELLLFPNPATEQLTVQFHQIKGRATELSIYDLNGRQILSMDPTIEGNESLQSILDIASLPAGTYLVQVKSDAEILQKKFMKME